FFTINYHMMLFKPQVLRHAIFFQEGDLYSLKDYSNTINALNVLGVWKFVTIQLDTVPGTPTLLDAHIELVPAKVQSMGVNLEVTTSTDYVVGSGLNLTYQDKNVHRAANVLTLSLKTGLEFSSSDSTQNFFLQAQNFSGQVNMLFPRFIVPWKIKKVSLFSNAKTILDLSVNYTNRLKYFNLTGINGSFGYAWKESDYKTWILKPIFLEYNRFFNISNSFQQQLNANLFLKNSFLPYFSEGEDISFIYNNQDIIHQKRYDYFRISLEESGFLLNNLNGAVRAISGNKTDFKKLTSLDYSRYIKTDGEFKHYFNRVHSTLVSRIYAGIGIPVGGSGVLPYIKQFYAGGPNSMRAWRLRALGPGSYLDTSRQSSGINFLDQTGEMKLEANLEFRFDMLKLFGGSMMLRGALFTDAGNIWNIHSDAGKPGSTFSLPSLYPDLAIGSGFGLRLDFSYFLIRLDVATPIKQPYTVPGYGKNGWVQQVHFLDGYWRKNNLVYNFAVGYPF
ncbi:MAG: translocation and assembly module lipoprotein TamL, partial [Chitinophagaceae bacterium]